MGAGAPGKSLTAPQMGLVMTDEQQKIINGAKDEPEQPVQNNQ